MTATSKLRIPRRATQRLSDGRSTARSLSTWRTAYAYVLLGEPGSGKTETFKAEASVTAAVYKTARAFTTVPLNDAERGKTLFIDGLDEMRAGSASRNTPLDQVLRHLNELGWPSFRIACREAEWISAVDAKALCDVAPGEPIELQLEPLNESEVRELLEHWRDRVPDAKAFCDEAERQNLTKLLGNPLFLELLVDAVRGGHWPTARTQTYDLACRKLVSEHNPTHLAALRTVAPSLDEKLDDAGLLCALLLLAGAEALTFESKSGSNVNDVSIDTIPEEFGMRSPYVLTTTLFQADVERRVPRHRTIAEYLAAKSMASRVAKGLPISRLLALMSGHDGGIVEPMRGLHAWLAVHCVKERSLLIERDPLGVVLYGDVKAFSTHEKSRILEALGREAERFVWFRNEHWATHPFGALGTQDMIEQFRMLLADSSRTPAHQSLLDCVLDSIRHGSDLPELKQPLEQVLRDNSYRDDVRQAALSAWLAQSKSDPSSARDWLDEIEHGSIEDSRDELCGALLEALYPIHVGPHEVLRYFHDSKTENYLGLFSAFWSSHLIERTPRGSRTILADQLAKLIYERSSLHSAFRLQDLIGQVVEGALEESDENERTERIYGWLQSGLDDNGFVALTAEYSSHIRSWLEAHPTEQKKVVTHALDLIYRDVESSTVQLWRSDQLMYRARHPRDWYRWLLEHAGTARSDVLARYCFDRAAQMALQPQSDFDISMEDVEQWVAAEKNRWPNAHEWLEEVWSVPMDHWESQERRRIQEYNIRHIEEREQRGKQIEPHADLIRAGTAPPHLFYDLALAYRGRFTNIRGETPEARVRDYLGADAETRDAEHAIAGFERVLKRTDLPSPEEIISFGQGGHYIRPACLLGAELAYDRDCNSPQAWSNELASQLVAFWLTDGTGRVPEWYQQLATQRPTVVASVLVPFAKLQIRKRAESSVTGLWLLSENETQRDLARLALPPLLQGFPARANAAQLRTLNYELLPAAIRHVSRSDLAAAAKRRLELKSLDAAQRIAWHVASITSGATDQCDSLLKFVGKSQTRAVHLGVALASQRSRINALQALSPAVLARLIEVLAPHTTPDYGSGPSWVGDAERRRDLVRALISQLAAARSEEAGNEMARLRSHAALAHWAILLDAERSENTRALRASRFMHANSSAVARTLANHAPANASDLAALVIDHLRTLIAHVRGDDTNSLRQFWRADEKKRQVPEIENTCRDAILGMLRPELMKLSVQLEKEASAANDTRADLRAVATVDSERVVVPIEIKKQEHKHLWTAWRDQLDGRYLTDPAAQGIGVYLVLWFGAELGAKLNPKSSSTGERPRSAGELESMLRSVIPPADRIRLSVVVLDLSLPVGPM